MSSRTVAIVGRPNVGKSALFNRLAGRRISIVHDQPGVTRDIREASAQLGDLAFTLLDTAGWETIGGEALEARMRRFTERAVDSADVVLFLIDARAGVLPLDESFANWLRKSPPSPSRATKSSSSMAAAEFSRARSSASASKASSSTVSASPIAKRVTSRSWSSPAS